MATDSFRPSAALAAYAEPWLDGRRVLSIGDATSGLADQLLDRGARLVHVIDADRTRLSEAATRNTSQSVSFAPLPDASLALRDGAFDVAIVDDLAVFRDPESVLERVQRALAPSGVAIIASPNPETKLHLTTGGSSKGIDYYALYDLVAEHFDEITMLGQTPFVGYAVASFAPLDEPQPTIDSSFVPGGAEEPEWFVAVASQRSLDVEEYAVVQLPFRQIGSAPRSPDLEQQLGVARTAERQARDRMASLEAELAKTKKAVATAGRETERAGRGDHDELRAQLAKRDAWIAQLEARAAAADARADEAQEEADQLRRRRERKMAEDGDGAPLRAKLEQLAGELDDVRKELLATRERADRAGSALEAARSEVGRERERARSAEARAKKLERASTAPDDALVAEVTRLEGVLRERGHRIRALEQELREAELTGRELLRRWSERDAPSESSEVPPKGGDGRAALERKLDELAELNARQQADLEAAGWTIEELEHRLDSGTPPETASELERAQTELQRQAALIEQLRSEHGERR